MNMQKPGFLGKWYVVICCFLFKYFLRKIINIAKLVVDM